MLCNRELPHSVVSIKVVPHSVLLIDIDMMNTQFSIINHHVQQFLFLLQNRPVESVRLLF